MTPKIEMKNYDLRIATVVSLPLPLLSFQSSAALRAANDFVGIISYNHCINKSHKEYRYADCKKIRQTILC